MPKQRFATRSRVVTGFAIAVVLAAIPVFVTAHGDTPAPDSSPVLQLKTSPAPQLEPGPLSVKSNRGHIRSASASPPQRTPMQADGGASAAAIIGRDDRVRIDETAEFPWSAIAYLELYDHSGKVVGSCTGTLISENAILTAGHCLYQGYWIASDIAIVPGKNGAFEPFGWFWASSWWVPDEWYHDPSNLNWDWGIITFDSGVSLATGWWYIALLSDSVLALPDAWPAIIGYPGDKPRGTMWGSAKPAFLSVQGDILRYDIDTYPGQSGSAVVLIPLGEHPELVGLIVAVHVRGAVLGGMNEGMRITRSFIEDLSTACFELGCQFDYFTDSPVPTPTATPTPGARPTQTPTRTPTPPAPPPGGGFRLRIPLLARD